MKKQPRFTRMLENDSIVLASFTVALLLPSLLIIMNRVIISLQISFPILEQLVATVIISLISLTALGILVWRVWLIYAIFQNGIELPGKLTAAHFLKKGWGDLHFDYSYQKTPYSGTFYAMRTLNALSLKEGKKVKLMLDPKHPGRILIRDLYL